MSRISGDDTAGRHWEGERHGNTIEWKSNDGLKGTETVRDNPDGTTTGISSTGDVVPCHYDGETWHGNCPSGDYVEED